VFAIPDLRALLISAEQRDLLQQALADAVCYRDPPVNCETCPEPSNPYETPGDLCNGCAAGFARASAYLNLGRELEATADAEP
jgi:hypothetical protein